MPLIKRYGYVYWKSSYWLFVTIGFGFRTRVFSYRLLIGQEYIEDIRSRTDIVELIGEYVRLKRQGSNFVGLCPFHSEKSPSFNVNPTAGFYHCFGCGVGGDAFKFLMQIENLSFPESIRLLAERAGVQLPETEEDTEKYSEIESIHHALRFAGRYYFKTLTTTDEGKKGLDYLLERGFTEATIKQYGLGYALDEWDGLLNAATEKHISEEILEKAGLIIPRKDNSGYYDRYRGRVMFPIFSHIGKVIGFGGRILVAADGQAKYINSPETSVYQKSKVLYGLYQGKNTIRKKEEVILVEGYTDVLALHQAGIEQAVASSGTALTVEQIKLVKRYANRVLILYDADSAGARAALRGIELLLKQGVAVYGLSLPAGEDPDSYVRTHGGEAFESYVAKEKRDFIRFLHAHAKDTGLIDTPEGQAQLTRRIIELIASIPDAAMYDPFVRQASHVLDIPDLRLFGILDEVLKAKALSSSPRRARAQNTAPPLALDAAEATSGGNAGESEKGGVPAKRGTAPEKAPKRQENPLEQEKLLLHIMLDHGAPMVEYIMSNLALDEFTPGTLSDAVGHILELYEKGRIDKTPFIDGTYGAQVQKLVTEVLMRRYEPSKNWKKKQNIMIPVYNEDPYEAAFSAMKQLKKRRIDQTLDELRKQVFNAEKRGENVTQLQQEIIVLQQYLKEIEDPESWHGVGNN